MSETSSKVIDFSKKNAQILMKRMYSFYTKGTFCDAEVVIGKKSYFSHKLILRANGEYFKEHLTKNQNKVVLKTEHKFNKNAIDSAIGFFYHGAMTLKQFGEMVDMIKFARLVTSERLENYCFFALENGVGKGNFRYAIEVGEYFQRQELLECVQDYLLNHFVEATKTDDFIYLTEDRLMKLFRSNELRLANEKDAFEGLKLWLNHDWINRKQYVERLLAELRMPLLPIKYLLEDVRAMCLNSLSLSNMIIDTMAWHNIEENRPFIPVNSKARFPPKVCVLAIGGDHIGVADVIESYNPYTNTWSLFHAMESGLVKYSAVSLDATLMWFGGERVYSTDTIDPSGGLHYEKSNNVNEAWSMELASKTVSAMPGMSKCRIGLQTAVVNRMVYVIGGTESQKPLKTVSRWDPRERIWIKMASLLGERHLYAAVVHRENIYILGNNGKINILEVYNTKANKWSKLPAMTKNRDVFAAVCVDDYIYAIGGLNGVTPLSSVERYNINTKVWDQVANMPVTVWSGAAIAYHNKIIVVGGYGSEMTHEYNIETNTWKALSSLVHKRHCHNLVLIPPEFVHNPQDRFW